MVCLDVAKSAERVEFNQEHNIQSDIQDYINLAVAYIGEKHERTKLLAESNAYLERGVYGKGGPTDIYPDWVYEARDAIRRQNENPPHYLPELLAILGWQGGTYHQALKAVQRLVEADKDHNRKESTR